MGKDYWNAAVLGYPKKRDRQNWLLISRFVITGIYDIGLFLVVFYIASAFEGVVELKAFPVVLFLLVVKISVNAKLLASRI